MNKKAVQDGVQDAHEWLSQVRKLDELINAKLAERDQLMDLATKCTPNMDGMPHGSGTSDKVGNSGVKLGDMVREIDSLIDSYLDYKRDVLRTLEKLPCVEYAVLHRHYIRYMDWEDIAADLGFSTMQIWRIKVKGLKNLKRAT
jgi:hypothetical protein